MSIRLPISHEKTRLGRRGTQGPTLTSNPAALNPDTLASLEIGISP